MTTVVMVAVVGAVLHSTCFCITPPFAKKPELKMA